MSDLSGFRTRILAMLVDTGVEYGNTLIDESLLRALDEYSQYNPLAAEALITLPGDGWEVALNEVTGLLRVTAIHWPYDSTKSEAEQYANEVSHWFLWWDDGMPVVTLVTMGADEPKEGDEVRIWYEKAHEIAGLAGGTFTSLPTLHESILVVGGAAFAAMSKGQEMMLSLDTDMYGTTLVATWGRTKEKEFRQLLRNLASQINQSGPQRAGWQMDKWDREY